MSRPRPGALIGGILLCHLAAFLAFVLYSIFDQPPELLAPYQLNHAFCEAALLLLENMPALTAAGAMVAYSLFPGGSEGSARGAASPVVAVVRPALVALLALTLVYVVASGLAAPLLYGTLGAMEEDSVSAAAYRKTMDQAEERAKKSGSSADYHAAYEAATRYLELDPANAEMVAAQTALEKAYVEAAEAERAKAAEARAGGTPVARKGEDPVALLRKAQAFYDAGDYYSAHYYAGLAQRSAVVRQQAAELVAAAERQISPKTVLADKATTEEIAAAKRAMDKREAYALYEQGDWVAAFYRFGELSREYPEDRDVVNYLALSREKVLETGFPIGDAQEALRSPGAEGLLFTVDRGEKGVEVVSIRKMVQTTGGVYLADIEALRVTPGVGPTLHLFARYGMLSGTKILLNAVDEVARDRSEEPQVYLSGDPGELTVVLDPGYDTGLLSYIRPDPLALRAVPTAILWGMRQWASRSGLLQEAVDLEIILFFARPFLFLTLGLAGLAVAWRYRARYYGRPAAAAFLSLAAFPFAMRGVWWLLVDAVRLAWGACLAVAGFVPTAVVAGIAHALLLLVALVLAARGTID